LARQRHGYTYYHEDKDLNRNVQEALYFVYLLLPSRLPLHAKLRHFKFQKTQGQVILDKFPWSLELLLQLGNILLSILHQLYKISLFECLRNMKHPKLQVLHLGHLIHSFLNLLIFGNLICQLVKVL